MDGTPDNPVSTLLIVGDRSGGFDDFVAAMADTELRVVRTETGEDALNVLGLNAVDMALVSTELADGAGLDVCREVRATPGIRDVPLFLIGPTADAETRIGAFDAGVEDYLDEALGDLELAARVRAVVGLNRYRRLFDQAERLDDSERQLAVLRQYDQTTGLPNEKMFRSSLEQELERAERSGYPLAVLVVDISEYDDLVGVYGRDRTEELARAVADRLAHAVRGRAVIGRLDTSSFVICQPLPRAEELTAAVHNYRRAVAGRFRVNDEDVKLSSNVGASLFPSDGRDADRLVGLATTAMSHARQTGRNRYHVYAPAARAEAKRRLRLESRIGRAIENEELELYYQPRLNLCNGEVTAVEALMRMREDSSSFISPDEFIPVAEDAGLMDALGRWALARACRDAATVLEWGHDIRMAVNIAGDLFSTDGFLADVQTALKDADISGASLELEITESALRPQLHQGLGPLRRKLTAIRAEGISVAVDDFGTGFSCLDNLRHLPLDVIKIDREFVAEVPTDKKAAAVVQSIVSLGFNLDLRTVAEGVETDKQVRFLNDTGCEEAQGYLYAKPVPFTELEALLSRLYEDWSVTS